MFIYNLQANNPRNKKNHLKQDRLDAQDLTRFRVFLGSRYTRDFQEIGNWF